MAPTPKLINNACQPPMSSRVKVLCVIDTLGSGGAQKQISSLAKSLNDKGYFVDIATTSVGGNFFLPELQACLISVHSLADCKGFSLKTLFRLIKLVRRCSYDVIISYQLTCNAYCIASRVFLSPKIRLIVSERVSTQGDSSQLFAFLCRIGYCLASKVVSNSWSHAGYLSSLPWLRNKLAVIYNGYDYSPPASWPPEDSGLRFLVVGRVSRQKNGTKLVKALIHYSELYGNCPSVSWAGRQENDCDSIEERRSMDRLINSSQLVSASWRWLGESSSIPYLLSQSHALILVSIYEGLPNAICESFMSGRPVIASSVSDHSLLIGEEERGLLCDPLSALSIAAAIRNFIILSTEERREMGQNAHSYARDNLLISKMTDCYVNLFSI